MICVFRDYFIVGSTDDLCLQRLCDAVHYCMKMCLLISICLKEMITEQWYIIHEANRDPLKEWYGKTSPVTTQSEQTKIWTGQIDEVCSSIKCTNYSPIHRT
jgi:hypothetical protein